jgi:MFS family permease
MPSIFKSFTQKLTDIQKGGLMWIQDLFFLHQHARKINIWALALVISPFLGPLLGAFMVNFVSWRWPYWVFSIEIGLIFNAIVLFVDETYYNRDIPVSEQPPRVSRFKRLIGTEQWKSRHQRNTFLEACYRPIQAMRWPVFIPCFFYLVTFAWSVGINNALSVFLAENYGFSPKNTGKLRSLNMQCCFTNSQWQASSTSALSSRSFWASPSATTSTTP